jgi:hypothetical protein
MKSSMKKANRPLASVPTSDASPSFLVRVTGGTSGLTLIFGTVIVLFGVVNVFVPDVFLLFGFYTSAGMSTTFQIMWVLSALLALSYLGRSKPTFAHTEAILLALSCILVVSFVVFRVKYPSLFADGEIGGQPTDMQLPSTLDKVGEQLRLPNYLCMKLFRVLPDWVNLDCPFVFLFRNYELNNAWLVVTFGFGVLLVVLLVTAILTQRAISGAERLWLWMFLACSCPMLNAYGFYDSYIHVIFFMAAFFVGAWMIADNPASWKGYAFFVGLLPFSFFTHQYLWATLPYICGLGGLIFLDRKGVKVPFMLLVVCGVVAGCAPLASYALTGKLLSRVYSYHLGQYLLTQGMTCILVSLPALLLAGGLLVKDAGIIRNPSPIQGMAVVVLIANITVFVFPVLAPSPPTMIHNYGAYGSAIYGCAVLLYLSSVRQRKEEDDGCATRGERVAGPTSQHETVLFWEGRIRRDGKVRLLAFCAVFGVFTFVPTVYVHSTRLCYERFVRIVPNDITSWWSRDMSPYVCLGLWTPVDSEQDRQARLDLFRQGFSAPRPEWEDFRALNLIYYIAWCFEFGKTQEGTRELVKVFGQQGIVRDLWMNGTRFTDRYDNKAYRRIRDVSRKIITENLKRQPMNGYLMQMSQLLDQYEKFNP